MLRRPSVRCPSVRCPSTIFKELLLWNRCANRSQISFGASIGWVNESLFGPSGSPRPYVVKTLQKSSFPESNGQWPWALVYSIGALGPSKFVQMLILGWPWPILWQGQIWSLLLLYGKTVRKSFNGRILQQMTRVTWGLCYHKNSEPRGLSVPALGLYTCIKTSRNVY